MLRGRDPQRAPAPDVEMRLHVRTRDDWTLDETPVPQARQHDLTVELLRAILEQWARSARPGAQVGSNLAVRWDEERPNVGVDPDVYLVDPAPPEGDDVTSLRLWMPGHHPPAIAVEVVSPTHPTKGYAVAPAKYAVSGTDELWIFDPLLAGPVAYGGPHRLQVWTRHGGAWARLHAGEAPARSPALGAWLVTTEASCRLRVADDRDGARLWPTAEESERAAKEVARAGEQRAIVERDAALARVAELEAELRRR